MFVCRHFYIYFRCLKLFDKNMKAKICTLLCSIILCLPFFIQAQTQLGSDIDGVAANNYAGAAVAISADGKRVAVPAKFNTNAGGQNAGHVRIFEWSGSQWLQMGSTINGEAAFDNCGYSVSLSPDGNVVAIGAINNDGNGSNSGHTRVYSWNGSNWVQRGADINGESADDNAGWSVSLSADGSRLAIGAANNDGGGTNSGHVRVYTWVSPDWVQMGTDLDGEKSFEYWGWRVALSADGNRLAVSTYLNANSSRPNAGRVKVFSWNGANWIAISGNILGESIDDNFGFDLSIAGDGNTIAVGAPFNTGNGTSSGSVRVYAWDGSLWSQKGADIDGRVVFDNSGHAVALSYDGSKLVIGANGRSNPVFQSGLLIQYVWNGTSWVQNGSDMYGEAVNDALGFSVAISQDGNRIAGGTYQNAAGGVSAGHVRIFQFTAVLPVNLISFSAYSLGGNKATINWEISGNPENDFFEIEKSADGLNWYSIVKLAAVEPATQKKSYSIIDNSPYTPVTYYRLKQTGQGGIISYSKIVKIKFISEGELTIYPNPSKGKLLLNTKKQLSNTTLTVYSISGQKVYSQKLSGNKVDISSLPNGEYIFSLAFPDETLIQKVMKK
jgi:Secretion system C-terminal sorting domain/FG-GAP repeat